MNRNKECFKELEKLRLRLSEAEETLNAIQNGQVDAVVVNGSKGTQVFTLEGSDYAYRILIEEMNEGVALLTTDLSIYYCNSKLASMLEIPLENMIGKPITDFIPSDQLKKCKIPIVSGSDSSCKEEISRESADGTLMTFQINISFLEKIDGYYVIVTDLTEQKKSEHELHDLLKDLERSNKELQQFAYVSSHDLQEPLRAIASFTQLLERRYKGKFDSDADEFMDYIVEAAKRMQQMILDLLEFSRVTTNADEFKEIDTAEAFDEALFNLRGTIEYNNAVITRNDLPTVTADKSQLAKVFQNLIANAIKFKKENVPPKIHISAREDPQKNQYIFSIQDNGIGMDPQYAGRIFTLFQRLHTRDEYQGTGIGLSVAKRIIERHGGHIWVESELGKGSTFYFTLQKS
ncbi:MAG TPA: ATP-binding protein [Methanobacterium sp.]|nr:ATP-binding protein [Methanobacterium sp.]